MNGSHALKLGVDHYIIIKPCSPTGLVAQIRTALRRPAAGQTDPPPPTGEHRHARLVIDNAEQ